MSFFYLSFKLLSFKFITSHVLSYCFYLFQMTVITFDVDKLPLAPDVLNTWAHLISTASADFRGPKRKSRHNGDITSDYGKKDGFGFKQIFSHPNMFCL